MSSRVQIDKNKLDEFLTLKQMYLDELKNSKTNVNKYEVAEWLIDLAKVVEEGVVVEEMNQQSSSLQSEPGIEKKTTEERVDHLEHVIQQLVTRNSTCRPFTRDTDSTCFRATKGTLFVLHVIALLVTLVVFLYHIRFVTNFYKYSDQRLEDLHPEVLANMSEEDVVLFKNKHSIYVIIMLVVSVVLYHLQILTLIGIYLENRLILIAYIVLGAIISLLSVFAFSVGSGLAINLLMVALTAFFLFLVHKKPTVSVTHSTVK